jgi:uncharacterized membrane protein YgcG
MKQIANKISLLRKVILLTLLVFMTAVQYSCQPDEEIQTTTNNKNIIDQPYTQIFKNDNTFALAMSELKKSNSFEKTSKEINLDFEVVTETVRIIKRNNYTTYILLVKRDQKTKNSFENLIIETVPEKAPRYLLIKYFLNKSRNKEFVSDPENGLYGDVKISELNTGAITKSNTTNKSECITLLMEMCMYGGTEHCAGPRCRTTYTVTSIFCGDSSTGTGGTIGDGGSGGYTGGSGSYSGGSGGYSGGTNTGGTATYLPPRVFIDENGDLVEDPYGYDEEMKEFLRLNPAIDAQVKEFLRTHITINDKIAVNNSILSMMMNHQLSFNEALALYYYQKQNPTHAAFLTEKQSAAKSIGAYLVKNNSSSGSVGFVKEMLNQSIQTGSPETVQEIIDIIDIIDDGVINGQQVVVGPNTPITNMAEYLKCFNPYLPATITIYADQPVTGSHQIISTSERVGHAFISITQGTKVRTLGFYPQGSVGSIIPNTLSLQPNDFLSTPGVFGNDQGHPYDVSLSLPLNPSGLASVINGITSIAENNPQYNIGSMNCTDLAIIIFNSQVIMDIPNSESPSVWSGQTPGTLGEVIRYLDLPPGIGGVRNVNGGNAPINNSY